MIFHSVLNNGIKAVGKNYTALSHFKSMLHGSRCIVILLAKRLYSVRLSRRLSECLVNLIIFHFVHRGILITG